MTSEQKIQAATALKAHSPVAVAPLFIGYAARCAGMSQGAAIRGSSQLVTRTSKHIRENRNS